MRSTTVIAFLSITAWSSFGICSPVQEEKPAEKQVPVSSITVSYRPGILSSSPPFGILLKRDGSALMVARREKSGGTYKATGLSQEFEKVADALNKCSFWKLGPRFGPPEMSRSALVVSVNSLGTTKTITDAGLPIKNVLGRKAPLALVQVEQLMTSLRAAAQWKKISDKTDLAILHANDAGEG